MKQVGLDALPDSLMGWLPDAEKLVESRRDALLDASVQSETK